MYKMKSDIQTLVHGHAVKTAKLDNGVEGVTLEDGTIVVDKDLSPIQRKIAVSHEAVHRDQIMRGALSYDDENVYWNNKVYPRRKMKEGSKNLEWEKEAYAKQLKK